MKEVLQDFVESVYPGLFNEQDKLFIAVMYATDRAEGDITLKEFIQFFEEYGEVPAVSVEKLKQFTEEAKNA